MRFFAGDEIWFYSSGLKNKTSMNLCFVLVFGGWTHFINRLNILIRKFSVGLCSCCNCANGGQRLWCGWRKSGRLLQRWSKVPNRPLANLKPLILCMLLYLYLICMMDWCWFKIQIWKLVKSFFQIQSANLQPLQRMVEDINDQASDFTASNVVLSSQVLSRLEDINTRWGSCIQ